MAMKVEAVWQISLDVECPECEEYQDLTEVDEFWHDMLPIEHGTPRSNEYEVCCSKCKHKFTACFVY